MQEKCYDIFKKLDLPFETYLSRFINHKNVIHEEMEIIWVIKGNAILTVEGKEFLLKKQTVFLVYMYREHSIKSDQDSIIVTYRLKKEYLHKHKIFFEKVDFVHRVYTFEELAKKYPQVPLLIVQIINLLLSDYENELIRYKIIGYYQMYILDLYRIILKERYLDVKHINFDEYLNRIHLIVEYTYKHYSEKISLDKLAEITHVSTYRISHFIKESFGISYRTFLQNSRFEQALKQLKNTNKSIANIAKSCGFSDHKYLNEMMKKKFNTTALKYRKNLSLIETCTQMDANTYDFIRELKFCLKKLESDIRFKKLFGFQEV